MKFTFPIKQQDIIDPVIRYRDASWEYRFATNAVYIQGLVGGLVLLWFWRFLPPSVPLWYSKPWGEERLASPWFLLLPIATAWAVYGINILIVARIGRDIPMFARVLFLTSLLVSFLSVYLILRIVTLVS